MSKIVAGIDDATKCPCIGSIFVAGVVADEKTIKKWKRLGVKDSKLVARKKRDQLAAIIQETALTISIQQLTPAMIDNKSFNLNEWEMLTVFKIISDLQESVPEFIYVDNWETSEKKFRERYEFLANSSTLPLSIVFDKKNILDAHIVPEHRADETYTVVGAASILAKYSSDKQYEDYKERYGDFGSGSPGDPKTRLFVWKHRFNPPPIVRTSWNTYKTLAPLERIEDDYLYSKPRTKRTTAK